MITIVCDSTANMTEQESEELGVKVVPVSYYTPSMTFEETFIDKSGDYEKLISSGACKTSHTNNAVFTSAFSEIIKQGNEVLCITLSSRLSGTHSSALIAAKEVASDKVMVVDSLSAAGGLFMLVKKARELIQKGKTLIETAFEIEKLRDKVNLVFSVNDMTPLRRSGRLGIVRQSVGTILNIRPILLLADGAIVSDGSARGTTEQVESMVSKVPADCAEVIIHYINNYSMTAKITKALEKKGFKGIISLRKIGPVLGVHLGLSVTGIVWIK
jgi:DegV family protein with EDD domain